MIALVEGAKRQRTPNEIALAILLAGLTIVFLMATVTLRPFGLYAGTTVDTVALIALLVCLIPTTIGGLLSAIGIAGMDRVARFNVLAMSGRAVEASGDVDVILLDKTGTITYGNRLRRVYHRRRPASPRPRSLDGRAASPRSATRRRRAARSSTLARERLASSAARRDRRRRRLPALAATIVEDDPVHAPRPARAASALTDGDDRPEGRGRCDRGEAGGAVPTELSTARDDGSPIAGGTPLARRGATAAILGVIELKDTVKQGLVERFAEFRRMGIRTVMITGDNPRTAATIAKEAGVDDFVAEAKPEDKIAFIRERAGRGPPGRDDRRRDERRAGARPGRRRAGDEQRHVRGQGSGQHGRPRLRPDQAARGHRDRQAAADHARRDHDVLDRQRRGQVLRDRARRCSSRSTRSSTR